MGDHVPVSDCKVKMEPKKSSIRALKVIAATALMIYVATTEVRLRHIEGLLHLAYDASTCCETGTTQEDVRTCLRSRGYSPRVFDGDSDQVDAGRPEVDFSFVSRFVIIQYDKDKKVVKWSLNSAVSALERREERVYNHDGSQLGSLSTCSEGFGRPGIGSGRPI